MSRQAEDHHHTNQQNDAHCSRTSFIAFLVVVKPLSGQELLLLCLDSSALNTNPIKHI